MTIPVGSVVGPYRVERVVGIGGTGAVYAVVDPELPRLVALKVLSAHRGADPLWRRRFASEASIAASLDHPNIVAIYDHGETDEGQLWMAQQLVDGTDAHAALRHGPMPQRRAIHIVTAIADALDYAHDRDVIHGDVKPSNFLLAGTPGPQERVLLTDFGVARTVQSGESHPDTEALAPATLGYTAPEFLNGGIAGRRADVYSLGCSLFELLTGELPYADAPGVAGQAGAHLARPVPRVSTAAPGLPTALDTVIATALAKVPEDRYPTAGDLASAARLALLDAETQARPTRRVRKAAVALVVFALLGAGAVTAWALRGKTSAPFPDQTTRSYASDELPALLVDPGSVSDIMGIRLGPSADTFTGFLGNSISRPGCAALVLPLQESTYRETGAVAGYAQQLKPTDPVNRAADVIQAVAAFETPNLAEKFVERQTASWPACAYDTVTVRSPRPGQEGVDDDWRTGPSQRSDGVLITELINLDDRRSCQRAATAAANLVVDIRACASGQIGDQAVILARAIAGKVAQ